MISACGTGWWPGVLPTSITRTSGASSARSSRGPSRSATTTSAWPRSRRPRTVMSPVSPGPPPTRATEPAVAPVRARCRRSGRSPVSRAVATASRRAMARRGSPPALTAILTSSTTATAGVQAAEASWSEALTHQMRCASASAETCASTAASPVAVWTNQTPSTSEGRYGRGSQFRRPASASSASAGQATGATTVTRAPASSSPLVRRAATGPPPTTSTGRPRRRSAVG